MQQKCDDSISDITIYDAENTGKLKKNRDSRVCHTALRPGIILSVLSIHEQSRTQLEPSKFHLVLYFSLTRTLPHPLSRPLDQPFEKSSQLFFIEHY